MRHSIFVSVLLAAIVAAVAGCGGSGSSVGAPRSYGVIPASRTSLTKNDAGAGSVLEFAYVVVSDGLGSSSVHAYKINPTGGELMPVTGSPFTIGPDLRSITIDPKGRFAYVTGGGVLYALKIDATSGALTPVAGSPFKTGNDPRGVGIDPAGKFVYVTNYEDGNVFGFKVNAKSGSLTAIAGSPFKTQVGLGGFPFGVAVDPVGDFVYVTEHGWPYGVGTVAAYKIDEVSGRLRRVRGSPFEAADAFPSSVAIDPTGKFVFVSNDQGNNVSVYSIDAATGALMRVKGSPFDTGASGVIVVDPKSRFVFVTSGGVSSYRLDATGRLETVAWFAAGNHPNGEAVDPTGTFLYVTNDRSKNISAYRISAKSGELERLPGSPFTTRIPLSVAVCRAAAGTCEPPPE